MNHNFQRFNNIAGWTVFAIALICYWVTMEPTASYWDCGEFIAVSYKLEVPHPPGAPMFLLIGRMFSFLAFGDVSKVAYWINFSSVLAGAFTSLFLFWTITLFSRKVMRISKVEELTESRTWVIIGAGLVGSLAYTFSDSAWFSNVEAEVYAMSSFFTAFVVWAMLKWELIEDESKANRWLLLIFYMMGLSIGVHLLNLVTIPALSLIYYFKKYRPTPWGVVAAMLISLFIIYFINEVIIPGLPSLTGGLEIFFVNQLGLPFGSGVIFVLVLLIGAIAYGIWSSSKSEGGAYNAILVLILVFDLIIALASPIPVPFVIAVILVFGLTVYFVGFNTLEQKAKVVTILVFGVFLGILIWYLFLEGKKLRTIQAFVNVAILAFTFILIGYSSYATIVIRANYNTPINENDPSDVMSFVRYLKREQYGSRPLLHGQYFTAKVVDYEQGEEIYVKGKDKYEVADRRVSYKYDPKDKTILPRIWSTDPDHARRYRSILGLSENEQPSFGDNIVYMFKHQIGHMYVRYFFFNFAGRESDNQDADWMRPSMWFEKLPPTLAENEGRNNFFMIPFVLGLIGMFHQSVSNTRNFVVVGLLFLLTGVALVVYLNSPPTEPRERDYIYTGSYYAYSIWIGLAVVALAELLTRVTRNLKTAGIAATALCMSAPILMAKDGWDDHDRSKRYFSVDSAVNYLQSCTTDGILFTGGDNDTFPLWYSQEVEGIRTDLRVVVLSYYNTDWYIKQTMRQTYESEPFKYTLTGYHYRMGGPNEYLPYHEINGVKIPSMDLKEYLSLLQKDHPVLRVYPSANVVPTREITLKVDVDHVRKLGIVPAKLDSLIVPEMKFRLRPGAGGLEKKDLAMLDVLASSNWERPLYVNNTSLAQFNVDLSRYVVQEGNTYRILPVYNPNPQTELVNTDLAYENMLKKFQFRGMQDSTIYYTQDYRNFIQNHRSSFNALAQAFIDEGDKARAREVLLFSLEKMPDHTVRYDFVNAQMVEMLLEVGEKEKALEVANKLSSRSDALASYYLDKREFGRDLQIPLIILSELQRVLYAYGETETAEKIEAMYEKHRQQFESRSVDRSDF